MTGHSPTNRDLAGVVEHFWDFGYAVVRGLFGPRDLRALADAFDRVYARALRYPAPFRDRNVFYQIEDDPGLGQIVRMVQWPSYFDEVLAGYRNDHRILAVLEPLIGNDIKQIINQMHWKPPGGARGEFGYHQDIHFRRPLHAYRDPAGSFIQTMLAVDPHGAENGAVRLYPGSHKMGAMAFPARGRIMDARMCEGDLRALGLDPGDLVDLVLEPGDLAIWHLCTIHGSGPNISGIDRRAYMNGYVKAAMCDRGEWAFRQGRPETLGDPVLVHYEDLYRHPEPHFVASA